MDMWEAKLHARALMERWPTTPEQRQIGVEKMLEILETSNNERNKIMAFKALVAADAVNVKEQNGSKPGGNRFLIIAQQLGIDASSGHIAEGPGVINTQPVDSPGAISG